MACDDDVDYLCEEEKIKICAKKLYTCAKRRWLFVWRGVGVYLDEEEKIYICVKRRRWSVVYCCEEEKMSVCMLRKSCVSLWRGEDAYQCEEEKIALLLLTNLSPKWMWSIDAGVGLKILAVENKITPIGTGGSSETNDIPRNFGNCSFSGVPLHV